MNIFRCDNGEFKIENLTEFIVLKSNDSDEFIKKIDIYPSDVSFDQVAEILTGSDVNSFEIVSEDGEVIDSFENVKIENVSKYIGENITINVLFIAE